MFCYEPFNNKTHEIENHLSNGLDCPEHTIGIQVQGIFGKEDWLTQTDTEIVPKGFNKTIGLFEAINDNIRNTFQWNLNLNYRFKGTQGNSWTVDADYGRFDVVTDSYQPNVIRDPNRGQILNTAIFSSKASL